MTLATHIGPILLVLREDYAQLDGGFQWLPDWLPEGLERRARGRTPSEAPEGHRCLNRDGHLLVQFYSQAPVQFSFSSICQAWYHLPVCRLQAETKPVDVRKSVVDWFTTKPLPTCFVTICFCHPPVKLGRFVLDALLVLGNNSYLPMFMAAESDNGYQRSDRRWPGTRLGR